MHDLSQRQIDILKAIIQEYTETGEPVGSQILEKKYKLGFSPATIRNEMVDLAKKGYLKKAHFSSGRVPSAQGFRFYIQNLMKEKELSTVDEVAYKNSIWDERSEAHRMLYHATKYLAERTGLLSLATVDNGELYYAGVGNLLSKEEFLDLNLSRALFGLLDEETYWETLLRQALRQQQEVMCMLGEEDFRSANFEPCASVFGEFSGDKIHGFIGVVGPKRMYFDRIIPEVRYFSNLIESIVKEQGM